MRQLKTEIRVHLQADPGANISLTSERELLRNFQWISPKPVDGFTGSHGWAHCTGFGYLPLACDDGWTIQVPMYYCNAAVETIFSPQNFCRSSQGKSDSFLMHGAIRSDAGSLCFDSPLGPHTVKVPLTCKNGLYYATSYWYSMPPCNDLWEPSEKVDKAKARHI